MKSEVWKAQKHVNQPYWSSTLQGRQEFWTTAMTRSTFQSTTCVLTSRRGRFLNRAPRSWSTLFLCFSSSASLSSGGSLIQVRGKSLAFPVFLSFLVLITYFLASYPALHIMVLFFFPLIFYCANGCKLSCLLSVFCSLASKFMIFLVLNLFKFFWIFLLLPVIASLYTWNQRICENLISLSGSTWWVFFQIQKNSVKDHIFCFFCCCSLLVSCRFITCTENYYQSFNFGNSIYVFLGLCKESKHYEPI